jgi:hypothetical protein
MMTLTIHQLRFGVVDGSNPCVIQGVRPFSGAGSGVGVERDCRLGGRHQG